MGKITVLKSAIPERNCSGCKVCELVCSFIHTEKYNPKRARILCVDKGHGVYVPNVCRQCAEPLCARNCPTEAIRVGERKIIEILTAECIGCGNCVEACPFGGIFIDPIEKTAIACDLCGGDPICVKYCVPGVLRFDEG